jgi:riboflavin kinase / FMN adenylyltransferase
MTSLRDIADLATLPSPIHLAIGVFDGVHLGHRAVISHAIASAKESGGTACVVTFDPHPASVLRPDSSPSLLTSTRHKLRLLAALGVTNTLVIPFDLAFAATPPSEFISELAGACRLRQICVGAEWTFGKGRAGNVALLRALGGERGFEITAVPSIAISGEPVSSTAIRAALRAGDLPAARAMLGRDFSVLGTVLAGNKLGRALGFPTANIRPENEQLPPNGVYVVTAECEHRELRGVANVGVRPTIAQSAPERLVEVHAFDFDGELYGRTMEVRFLRFLRPEKKFGSLEELQAQIAKDSATARGEFAD